MLVYERMAEKIVKGHSKLLFFGLIMQIVLTFVSQRLLYSKNKIKV